MSTKLNFFIVFKLIGNFALEELQNGREKLVYFKKHIWKHPLSLSYDPVSVNGDSGYLCAAVYEGWFISWLQLCTEWSDHWVVFWQHGWISQWLSATQYANWTQACFLKCGSVILGGNGQVSFVGSDICPIVQCLKSVRGENWPIFVVLDNAIWSLFSYL